MNSDDEVTAGPTGSLNDPRVPCCGRDAADCDCEPTDRQGDLPLERRCEVCGSTKVGPNGEQIHFEDECFK